MPSLRMIPGAWILLSIPLALSPLIGIRYSAYKGHADDRDVSAVVAAGNPGHGFEQERIRPLRMGKL